MYAFILSMCTSLQFTIYHLANGPVQRFNRGWLTHDDYAYPLMVPTANLFIRRYAARNEHTLFLPAKTIVWKVKHLDDKQEVVSSIRPLSLPDQKGEWGVSFIAKPSLIKSRSCACEIIGRKKRSKEKEGIWFNVRRAHLLQIRFVSLVVERAALTEHVFLKERRLA